MPVAVTREQRLLTAEEHPVTALCFTPGTVLARLNCSPDSLCISDVYGVMHSSNRPMQQPENDKQKGDSPHRVLLFASLCIVLVMGAGMSISLIEGPPPSSFRSVEMLWDLEDFILGKDAIEEDLIGVGRAGVMADSLVVEDTLDAMITQALRPEAYVPEPLPEAEDGDDVLRKLGNGMASYYGNELAGNPTASGEIFDPTKLTAAHPTLPMGAHVRVTNLRNGNSVVVRINDRGPFVRRRIIDVSKRAARKLGMLRAGHSRVRVELLK